MKMVNNDQFTKNGWFFQGFAIQLMLQKSGDKKQAPLDDVLEKTLPGKQVAVNFHQLETPKNQPARCLKKVVRIPRFSR